MESGHGGVHGEFVVEHESAWFVHAELDVVRTCRVHMEHGDCILNIGECMGE